MFVAEIKEEGWTDGMAQQTIAMLMLMLIMMTMLFWQYKRNSEENYGLYLCKE